MTIWLPDTDEVSAVHYMLVDLFIQENDPIEPAGIKNQHLLDSALTRPHTGLGVAQKYKTLPEKVAALFHSLCKNHAFHNGNKRTALATLLMVLHRNDRRLKNEVSDDEVFDFVVSVAANTFPSEAAHSDDTVVSAIAAWVRTKSETAKVKFSEMRTADFVDKCRSAGATYKMSGGSHVVSVSSDSVKIANSTPKLSGAAVKSYLRALKLHPVSSGVDEIEFMSGTQEERAQLHRYMSALRRLAKT